MFKTPCLRSCRRSSTASSWWNSRRRWPGRTTGHGLTMPSAWKRRALPRAASARCPCAQKIGRRIISRVARRLKKKSEELEVVKAERKEEARVRVGDAAPGLSQRCHRAVRAGRVSNIEQFGEWDSSKMGGPPGTRDAMPNDSRRRAAEYHE